MSASLALFNKKWNTYTNFRNKRKQNIKSHKNPSSVGPLIHGNGGALENTDENDLARLHIAFGNCVANAPKNP
jgi:hypothetical protein